MEKQNEQNTPKNRERKSSASKLLTQYPYIKKDTEQNIKNFQYRGGSASITYQYLWSPLCQFLVELLPTTIAPNLITIFAFFWVVVSHLTMIYYSPDFQQPVPSWALIFTGITTLAYQILDNMDGKQARRTGSSSPLGMLFDHGLDSVTSWIFGVNQLICFGTGITNLSLFTLLFSAFVGFYVAQWSQYHIGVMQLGKINAVDEGLILVWNLLFFTGYVGVEFWQQEFMYNLRINDFAIIGLLILCISENTQFIYNTLTTKIHRTFLKKVQTLEQIMLLVLTFTVFIYTTPQEIMQSRYCYLFLISFGMLWSKSTLHLQIAHLGDQNNYNQWRISFLIACLSHTVNGILSYFFNIQIISQTNLILIMFVYAFFIFLHTSTNVVKQMAQLLEINVFSLKYKEQEKQKQQEQQQQKQKVA